MYKIILSLLVVLTIMLLAVSCQSNKQGTSDEMAKRCNPHSLAIDSTGSHYVKIAWNPGCPGTRIMQGFNIYYSPSPLATKYSGHEMPDNIKPFNREVYLGDPDGNEKWESFEFENIPLGQLFYVHVRVVNADNSLSLPSNEIEMVCYPQGIFELNVSYSGDKSGFSFVTGSHCATDAVENDLYFYSKGGQDFLCSPIRISDVNRNNKIYLGGKSQVLGDVNGFTPKGSGVEKTELVHGMIYIVETEGGHLAKLRLIRMEGKGDSRKAVFEYFYRSPVIKLERKA